MGDDIILGINLEKYWNVVMMISWDGAICFSAPGSFVILPHGLTPHKVIFQICIKIILVQVGPQDRPQNHRQPTQPFDRQQAVKSHGGPCEVFRISYQFHFQRLPPIFKTPVPHILGCCQPGVQQWQSINWFDELEGQHRNLHQGADVVVLDTKFLGAKP